MKILFAPSEAKNKSSSFEAINEKSFIFEDLFAKRLEAINAYNDFVFNANFAELSELFGLKEEKEILKFKQNILKLPTQKAIQRYSGVSFKHLDYESLDIRAKTYIDESVLIFSNLFGAILAKDKIPFYKFKQGAKIKNFEIEKFYKQHFTKALDKFLQDEDIIDLRAGFYEKFYTLKQKHSSYKFIKNGKVVSHFAKALRGELLRLCAKYQIQNNQDLLNKLPSNLKIIDIKIQGYKEEFCLEILAD
ncbi:peroxide stress protein YaaA [Campylobacter sp. MIT 99-7217]|uniref:YaaA family protein n=1 Tax=Campylobacter sp. MIT 99-7217 TaxID=535091 RepID=UPI00115B2704|nr:YaaA family protein [Campylobacter sp. MIT 99-7217]TQR31870.1 peroxide stress protein YaaA [Campylobacter sp. MIT 99-7217]